MVVLRRLFTVPIKVSCIRTFATTRPAMVARLDLSISGHNNEETVVREATNLIDDGRWRLCNGGAGLERDFKFGTFKNTWVCSRCSVCSGY